MAPLHLYEGMVITTEGAEHAHPGRRDSSLGTTKIISVPFCG